MKGSDFRELIGRKPANVKKLVANCAHHSVGTAEVGDVKMTAERTLNRDNRTDDNGEFEFFTQFAGYRFVRVFAAIHVAAGQSPARRLMIDVFGKQHLAQWVEQHADHAGGKTGSGEPP